MTIVQDQNVQSSFSSLKTCPVEPNVEGKFVGLLFLISSSFYYV
jgi:hypothetical protein